MGQKLCPNWRMFELSDRFLLGFEVHGAIFFRIRDCSNYRVFELTGIGCGINNRFYQKIRITNLILSGLF